MSEITLTRHLDTKPRKGSAFWLAFASMLVALFLSALDMSAIPTALPTIVDDLEGGDKFIWVGSAYGLASTSEVRFADVFGRKHLLLASITLFALGSALAGAAQDMNLLIVARVVQGLGGGAIFLLTEIITSDLVPLAERGTYQGYLILAYSMASGIGPVVGGVLSDKASWRWIFYLNLPVTGVAAFLTAVFLHLHSPEGSIWAKLVRMDWFGNALMVAGSTLTLIGLTWGGIRYSWSSAHVLIPLVLGIALMAIFFAYERAVVVEPSLPLDVLNNRTVLAANFATFVHGIVALAAIYYIPVYFQACKGASPMRSSVDTLPIALVISPFAILCGVTTKITQTYRPINLLGWVLSIIGFGLLTLLRPTTPMGQLVGFQFLMAAGVGIVWAAVIYPVLAPLPVTRIAAALGFFSFCRSFAQTWGITIAGVILQNQLKSRLPKSFVARYPEGVEIAYATIPMIPSLEEPLKTEVQDAFAASFSVIWKVMIGFCATGLLSVFLLKEIPMLRHTDGTYALKERSAEMDAERAGVKP
ncbi:MFS general substrate transporter [Dichomitus squalens LYAD-421 SS1]|uniref:MFS general substrate transporter n=1 Tax=Dichomitus squalens (strain LYAD-421) TaxID=732165 RepID=R7SYI1_DICSQ|nr:MFS general substrate transporter [Dichomitus squalens LYAD-421 SS1]EJF60042.1 MFS general substrate transporter [Dichomitus squalens LYAD-421 SS1]